MPGMCSVPGCKGYKKARSRGVVFHSVPTTATRDPERCRTWLKAIQSPRFDEDTPAAREPQRVSASRRPEPAGGFFLECPRYWCGYRIPFSLPDNSYPLTAKSRRREKGALSSSYEKRSSISTGTCMQEPSALSSLGCVSASERGKQRQLHDGELQSETTHVATEVDWLQDSFEEMEVTIDDVDCNSVKSRLSDLDSDLKNIVETTELSDVKAEDSFDEDVYVPIVPQRSTASELLLECEEEELEPWQKHTLRVHLKEEDDAGELSNDQTDCKPDSLTLQSWSACQHTVTPEACGVVHTSEVHQISNNHVTLSSVRSPKVSAASSNQLLSDQSNSQTLSLPFSLPCFTVVKLESTGTSNKQ